MLTSTYLFKSNPIFMVRLQVANVKGHLQPLSCLELLRILNFYTDLAPLKDGLNFDDRPLKTIYFL